MSLNPLKILVVLALLSPVTPALAVPLVPPLEKIPAVKWELQQGKTFYQTVTTVTTQHMKVLGQEVNQTQTQTFYFSWKVEAQDKDKNWIIKQRIDGVKMDIEIGGNKITYDSTKAAKGANDPLADFFRALIGAEYKFTISPKMEVTRVDGTKGFLRKLKRQNPQMAPLIEEMTNDEVFKHMVPSVFVRVPGTPDSKGNIWRQKGDRWEAKEDLNLGPIGRYQTTYKYTYQGKDGTRLKLAVEPVLTYHPPMNGESTTLPFRISGGSLKTDQGSTGVIRFDAKSGRVESSELLVKLKGTLAISIGQQETDVELTQTIKTTVKVTDTNPLKK